MDYLLGNEADIGMSYCPCYSSENEDLRKSCIHHVRFLGEMCVFELKTWGHGIFVFKSIIRFLGKAKSGARASEYNDLGPSWRIKLFAVADGAAKVNFAQGNACPANRKMTAGNAHHLDPQPAGWPAHFFRERGKGARQKQPHYEGGMVCFLRPSYETGRTQRGSKLSEVKNERTGGSPVVSHRE